MTDNTEKLIEARDRLNAILDDGMYCLCTSPGGSAFGDLRTVLDALEAAEEAHTPPSDLIEEAAEAIAKVWRNVGSHADMARAALSVFEKAHTPSTPTDDEREAAQRLLSDVNPKHRHAPRSLLAEDIRVVASAIIRSTSATDEQMIDEREMLSQIIEAVDDGRVVGQDELWQSIFPQERYQIVDAILAAGFRRTSVPEHVGEPHCDGCDRYGHHHCYHCGKRPGLPHPTWCPNFSEDDPIAAHGRELRRKYGDDVTVPGGTAVTNQGEGSR